jgi:hypothetical protein
MKQLLTIVVVVLLSSATVTAQNPDSRPSISFGLSGYLSSGKFSQLGRDQNHDGGDFAFHSSLKWPVSVNVTLNFGLGFATGKTEYEENFWYYKSTFDYKQFAFTFGTTFYIGQSINK